MLFFRFDIRLFTLRHCHYFLPLLLYVDAITITAAIAIRAAAAFRFRHADIDTTLTP